MESIFIRVISIVLSVLMSLFSTLSSAFPNIFPAEPIENTYEICEAEQFNITNPKENSVIISDYVSWYSLADKESEISAKYDWKYFFTGSLAVITLVLPDPGYELEIISVEENGNTLEVDYKTTSGDNEYAAVLVTKVIVVQVNKNVSLIDLNKIPNAEEPEEPVIPEIPEEPVVPENPEEPSDPNLPEFEGFSYKIYKSDNFDDNCYNRSYKVIQDYNSWISYYKGSDPDLDKYNEEFFADKNLAIVHIGVPADGKIIQITNIKQDSDISQIYLNFRVKNGESSYSKGCWSVVVETDKVVKRIIPLETGIKGETKLIDAEFFKSHEMGLVKEDGAYKIITSSNEYYKYITEDYLYTSNFSFSNKYFEDSNLALIYIMLPYMNGYYNFDVNVLSMKENGSTLDIEYSTVLEDVDEEDKGEAVKYFVMLVEVSKNITEINAVENSFKNIYKTFDMFPHFFDVTDNYRHISDYETWSDVCSSDLPYFDKYNEEYFENYSVVIVAEEMPDSGSFFDVIKAKENGNTFDLVYNIRSNGGTQAIEYKVLVVEVSKNIKEVSVQRKDIDYNYSQGGIPALEDDSAILISDYSQWQTYSSSSDTKYNEAYFEDHSLVFIKSTNPSSNVISTMRYLYEEDGVLNVGISKHMYYGGAGLAYLWSQNFVIEVDKNVTDVNLEIFY